VCVPTRVLIVDDSLVCRELLSSILGQQPDIQVVGLASRGKEAIELNRKLQPDLVTMDIQMPGMDGFATIEAIMSSHPVPILVVTSAPVLKGVDQTFRSIAAGALDLVRKPELANEDAEALVARVRMLAGVKVIRHVRPRPERASPGRAQETARRVRLVAIASSTGGPKALLELLGAFTSQFPRPVVVTQHLPDGFSGSFARWLDEEISMPVREAREGDPLRPGEVLVAPTGFHLVVRSGSLVGLSDEPPVKSLRPSADTMFRSVARVFGAEALGVVLTGMGQDGADGLLEMRQAGAVCLAQDEASSLIFGMPRAALQNGAAEQAMDLAGLAAAILAYAQGERTG
jgi:two-component system, chemotaxis family, protein-glutamate methylesterase/glutaminase